MIPLEGNPPTFDCYGRSIPAGEVLAVGFLEEDACFDKLREWEPECGGCGCAAEPSRPDGALWALGLLVLAARAQSRLRRSR